MVSAYLLALTLALAHLSGILGHVGSSSSVARVSRLLKQSKPVKPATTVCSYDHAYGCCTPNPAFVLSKLRGSPDPEAMYLAKSAAASLVCTDAKSRSECTAYPGRLCAWADNRCQLKSYWGLALKLVLCQGSKIEVWGRCAYYSNRGDKTSCRNDEDCTWSRPSGARQSLCIPNSAVGLSNKRVAQLRQQMQDALSQTTYRPDLFGCCPGYRLYIAGQQCQVLSNNRDACRADSMCTWSYSSGCDVDQQAFYTAILPPADAKVMLQQLEVCDAASASSTACTAVGKLPSPPSRSDVIAAYQSVIPDPATCPLTPL